MTTAVDDRDGDSFRIKIWDRATDLTVYDNQLGAGDDSCDATLLSGGSIVVHSGK